MRAVGEWIICEGNQEENKKSPLEVQVATSQHRKQDAG
jgi:hypothetical protein